MEIFLIVTAVVLVAHWVVGIQLLIWQKNKKPLVLEDVFFNYVKNIILILLFEVNITMKLSNQVMLETKKKFEFGSDI